MPKRYGKRRNALERIVRKYAFEPAQGKSIDGMLRLTEYLLARKLLAKQKGQIDAEADKYEKNTPR